MTGMSNDEEMREVIENIWEKGVQLYFLQNLTDKKLDEIVPLALRKALSGSEGEK